jgi:hypothetical protein
MLIKKKKRPEPEKSWHVITVCFTEPDNAEEIWGFE